MEWMSTSSRNIDFNQGILGNDEDLFWGKEILWCFGTTQDLEKDGNSGWDVGYTVNVEEWWVGLRNVQDKKKEKRQLSSPERYWAWYGHQGDRPQAGGYNQDQC